MEEEEEGAYFFKNPSLNLNLELECLVSQRVISYPGDAFKSCLLARRGTNVEYFSPSAAAFMIIIVFVTHRESDSSPQIIKNTFEVTPANI